MLKLPPRYKMDPYWFARAAVPALFILWILVVAAFSVLPSEKDHSHNIALIVPAAAIVPILTAVIRLAIFPLQILPQLPPASFYSRFFPLAKELFKMTLLVAANKMGNYTPLHHAIIIASLYSLMSLVSACCRYSPLDLFVYKKFYSLVHLWRECCQPPKAPEADTPLFNTDLFSLVPLAHDTSVSSYHPSLIDKVYCVLPKNTLHFAHDELSVPELSLAGSSDLCTPPLAPEDPLSEEVLLLPPARLSWCSATQSMSFCSQSSAAFEKAGLSWAAWFSWLLPVKMEPPKKKKSDKDRLSKKLLTYTLRSDSSVSSTSASRSADYGSIDLEKQLPLPHKHEENVHAYYEFAAFSNSSLDRWISLCHLVDPLFCKFGVSIPDFPLLFFIAYALDCALAQFVSLLVLAAPFCLPPGPAAGLVATHVVLLLFCSNYLRHQCHASYRVSVLTALGIRLASLAGLFVIYYCI